MDTWMAYGPPHIGAMWMGATTEAEAIDAGLELFRCADPSLTRDQVTAQFCWSGIRGPRRGRRKQEAADA